MKTILITGGAGFIGTYLCKRLLNHGDIVVCVDVSPSKIEVSEFYKFNFLNVNNTDALDVLFNKYAFDIVYHMASNTSIPKGQKDVTIDLDNTLKTTLSVLKLMVKHKVNKLVYFSSSTVYGNYQNPCNEANAHLLPISYYGAAKLASEAYVSAYSNLFNIQTWVIRPCNVIGPDAHGIIQDIKRQLALDKDTLHLLGDGSQEKPFIYVEDFLDGVEFVVNNAKEQYNLYLVGNDTTTSIKRMTDIVKNIFNPNLDVEWTENTTWPGDVKQYKFNIEKIKLLGWSPKYSSDDAVRLSLSIK